jgi:hypothetical protein
VRAGRNGSAAKGSQVIFIYGFPSVGKLAMASRIKSDPGPYESFVLDNHYFYDFIRPFVSVPDGRMDEYFDGVWKLRGDFLALIAKFYPQGRRVRYIFTGVLTDCPKDMRIMAEAEEFAALVEAEFIPIELSASLESMKSRVTAAARAARGKIHTVEKLEAVVAEYRPMKFDHANKLALDTSGMDEDAAFLRIKAHLAEFAV